MTFSQLLAYVNEFSRQFPWSYLVASGALSPMLASIKHWMQIEGSKKYKVLFIRFTGEQLMLVLLSAFSFILAGLHHIIYTPTQDPNTVVVQAALVAFMTQPVYYFLLKPAMAYFAAQVEKAVQLNMAKANAVAYSGQPATATVVSPDQTKQS